MTRCKCILVKGGWIGDDKVQNETIICFDILKNIEHHFYIKCIGEYEEHNEKELPVITKRITPFKLYFPLDCTSFLDFFLSIHLNFVYR